MFKGFASPAFVIIILLFSACKSSIKPEALYGRWNYIKVFKPEANPVDSVSRSELEIEKPYIEFGKDNKLLIIWGGKVLSHGTFTTDGDNIHFTEKLEGNQTRTFPFYVSQLTEKIIVFETLGVDGSRVMAVKSN
ncbi:hypothetical protein DJ568_01725 [Mucilaginibacter hurinus]|uniref:Lipocalin-like domain-containing protein n=1 Tax=Mucilaginibacter hurinus TaxID=2201324 RepID=A0A367GT57_9SPHI|nr:hypothetical protein [Mucilaginibacter hurinus]RCH56604.1 hypothetical protein DJ568_01725 [Mucilaginibacter hurinus]